MHVAWRTFKLLSPTTLPNSWPTRMKHSFLTKMVWWPWRQFNLKWPRPKMWARSSCKSNWLNVKKKFHNLGGCDQIYSPTSSLIYVSILSLVCFDWFRPLWKAIAQFVRFSLERFIFQPCFFLVKWHLTMSLIPAVSLLTIMESVGQSNAKDSLNFNIPACFLLSYFYSRFHADANTVSERLLFTLNVPPFSKQVCSTQFEGKHIPMLFPEDPRTALTWNIEAP